MEFEHQSLGGANIIWPDEEWQPIDAAMNAPLREVVAVCWTCNSQGRVTQYSLRFNRPNTYQFVGDVAPCEHYQEATHGRA